jgi:isoleucyl-tRNA synthetase
LKDLLASVDDNIAQLFIVSQYEFGGADVPEQALKLNDAAVVVEKAEGEKCERCWTISTEIGENEAHPTLCPRCASVVETQYA